MRVPGAPLILLVATTLAFSHSHTSRYHSGSPPCAMMVLPSALKLRLTYSCSVAIA